MQEKLQAKFTGLIAVDEPLNKENSYSIALEQCGVRRIDTRELAEKDEKYITYVLENLGRTNILTEKDKKPYLIKGKSKSMTKSQLFRLRIENKGYDYDFVMDKLMENDRWEQIL